MVGRPAAGSLALPIAGEGERDLPEGHPEYDDLDDFIDDGDDDEGWSECGMMPNGQCILAGTEWCDWDCRRSGR